MGDSDAYGGVSNEFTAAGEFAFQEGGKRALGTYEVRSVSEDRLTISATVPQGRRDAVLVFEGVDHIRMWHVDHPDKAFPLVRATAK